MKDKFTSILATHERIISEIRLDSCDEKEVIWYPENLKDEIKKNWTNEMRREIGFQLGRVQQGLNPDHFREMPSIAVGVREIKIQDENKSQYRLIYGKRFKNTSCKTSLDFASYGSKYGAVGGINWWQKITRYGESNIGIGCGWIGR